MELIHIQKKNSLPILKNSSVGPHFPFAFTLNEIIFCEIEKSNGSLK